MSSPVEAENSLQEPLLDEESSPATAESPPIIAEEETAVPAAATVDDDYEDNEEIFQGQVQPPAYRDVWCAVLFVMQVLLMLGTAGWSMYYLWKLSTRDETAPPALAPTPAPTKASNSTLKAVEWIHPTVPHAEEWEFATMALGFVTVTLAVAVLSSTLFLAALQRYSHSAIQISFLAAPVCSAIIAVSITLIHPKESLAFWGATGLALVVAGLHYFCSLRYIPFTAANLKAGLQALESSSSLYGYAVFLQAIAFIYWFLAVIALTGLVQYFNRQEKPCDKSGKVDDDDLETCYGSIPAWIVVMWLFSVYWTQSVLKNVLRATTAGAIGTWWFRSPEEDDNSESEYRSWCCCGCKAQQDVHDSWYRATTFSFGSICLGSLLLALVQVLEYVVRQAQQQRQRENQRDSILLCVLQCILEWATKVVDYFNSWAFLYVGLYGYSYTEAGKNVVTLFRQRGFTFLFSHYLLNRVLAYVQFGIGILSGGLLCALSMAFETGAIVWIFFGVGFLVGFLLAGMTLQVLESSVRTIMLCFAERPMDGAINRPEAYQTLTAGWSQVYPEHFPHTAPAQENQPLISSDV